MSTWISEPITENGSSPEIRALMEEVRRHHAPFDTYIFEQYGLHLSVSEPERLESIEGLWQCSSGLEYPYLSLPKISQMDE